MLYWGDFMTDFELLTQMLYNLSALLGFISALLIVLIVAVTWRLK